MSSESNWLEFFEKREQFFAEYYLEFAEQNSGRDPKAQERLETESGNLLRVIGWLEGQDEAERILRFAQILWKDSNFIRGRGFVQRGLRLLKKARQVAHQSGDLRTEFTWLDAITIAHRFNGNPELAIPLHEQALALAQEIGEPRFRAKAQLGMGQLKMEMGHLDDAFVWLDQALQSYRHSQDYKGEINTLTVLGNLLSLQGDPENAVTYLEQGLQLAQAKQDQLGELALRFALGYVYTATKNWTLAVKFHEPVVEMARTIGDRFTVVRALNNLGEAWLELGNVQQAKNLLDEALTLQEASDDILTKAFTHLYLAKVHNILNSPEISLAHLEHVYPMSQVPVLFHEAAQAAWVRADNYLKKNDTQLAQSALQEVLDLAPNHMIELRTAAKTLLNSTERERVCPKF